MSIQHRRKLNRLLQTIPQGTVITSSRLERLGISRQLAKKYVDSGWLVRLGVGAFARSGDQVEWQGGLHALQDQLGMTVHVAAHTALEVQGRSHYVPLGQRKRVVLVSDCREQLPVWFRSHPWPGRIEHHCLSLFRSVPGESTAKLDCGTFAVDMSLAERDMLEVMRLATRNDEIEHAHDLMPGLTTLRPAVTQPLLEACRSVKAKRLFLWSAETAGHAWFGRLFISRIDLGRGKRQLYTGGRLDPKYRITVPRTEELPGV